MNWFSFKLLRDEEKCLSLSLSFAAHFKLVSLSVERHKRSDKFGLGTSNKSWRNLSLSSPTGTTTVQIKMTLSSDISILHNTMLTTGQISSAWGTFRHEDQIHIVSRPGVCLDWQIRKYQKHTPNIPVMSENHCETILLFWRNIL